MTPPLSGSKPCAQPNCSATIQRGEGPRCPEHTKAKQARTHEGREAEYDGTLYGHRWRKARRVFLQEHPWCETGCGDVANEVDHIVPHRGDKGKFWDQGNWQGLCKACHSAKTMREINERREEG